MNYVQVAKLVVASAVNDEGEQVYPRTWNHDFIQLPVVRKDKQHRPTVTDADLKEILSNTKKQMHVMLFSLLAATGLRIGEAFALRATDFGPDCRVLHVAVALGAVKSRNQKRQTLSRRRHSRNPCNQTPGVSRFDERVSLCDKEGTATTAAKCFADSPPRQACGVPRVSTFPPDVAQKE